MVSYASNLMVVLIRGTINSYFDQPHGDQHISKNNTKTTARYSLTGFLYLQPFQFVGYYKYFWSGTMYKNNKILVGSRYVRA